MSLPSVYAYMDYRAFLSDWIQAKKRDDPSYSFTVFAKAAGCARAALPNVLRGARTPRPSTLDAFARGMDLGPPERNYLGMLVELDAAPDPAARRRVMERLLTTERYRQVRKLVPEQADDIEKYLARWYIPAIYELARLPGFRPDPAAIAARLHPRIDESQAQGALDVLFDLGFLQRNDQGEVIAAHARISSSAEAQIAAIAVFYRRELAGLLQQLDTEHHANQHLLTATVALPPSRIPEVKAELNQLLQRLVSMADDPQPGGQREIYQLGLQLLPLSSPPED